MSKPVESVPVESVYVFQGHQFLEYVDVPRFKSEVSTLCGCDEFTDETFGDFYTHILKTYPTQKNDFDKLLFDNILYGQLKNVYLHKIQNKSVRVEILKEKVSEILSIVHDKQSVSQATRDLMSPEGFYLFDAIGITELGTTFIAAYEFEHENGVVTTARFLVGQVVPYGERTRYFLAGIDLDFINNTCLIMIKNIIGIKSDENWENTVPRLYRRVQNDILDRLGIQFKLSATKDREGMYNMCKDLDTELLKETRKIVSDRTLNLAIQSTNTLLDALFKTEIHQPTNTQKETFINKLEAQLLGCFIEVDPKFKSKELVKMARQAKLTGYPTMISFFGNRGGKGATGSHRAGIPAASYPMFHSLYTDFQTALTLQKWSIAWFTDYKYIDLNDVDSVQTTIYATKSYFRVVFIANRHLNKEFVKHVTESLNRYRNY